MTMMTFDTEAPQECGIVKLNSEGTVTSFFEKVSEDHGIVANAAVYILEKEVIEFMEGLEKEEIDFSIDVIPNFTNRISTFHNSKYHRDIGSLKSYRSAQREFRLFKSKFSYEFKDDAAWKDMLEDNEMALTKRINESIDTAFGSKNYFTKIRG